MSELLWFITEPYHAFMRWLRGPDYSKALLKVMLHGERAKELDPEAFPADCTVVYFPPDARDSRQWAAIERAEAEAA